MDIIIDMDGTIIDAASSIIRCLNQTFEEMGHECLTFDEAVGLSGVPLDGILRSRLSEDELPEGRERYQKTHYSSFLKDTTVFPGARETLEKWEREGRKMAVFTLRAGNNAREILSAFDLLDLFDAVVGHDETQQPKPSPMQVETTARLLEIDPRDALVIGDNIVDIESGSRAGARTVGILLGLGSMSDLIAAGADHIVQDWPELDSLIEGNDF